MGYKKISPLTLTAFHEAGHAYMCLFVGLKFKDVILSSDKIKTKTSNKINSSTTVDMLFSTRGIVSVNKGCQTEILKTLTILHAGYIAEDIVRGRKRPGRSFESLLGSHGDLKEAKKCFQAFCVTEKEEILLQRWLEEHVWNVLKVHWVRVQDIAYELEQRKRLTYTQVRNISKMLS
jgi:hypothetical protein